MSSGVLSKSEILLKYSELQQRSFALLIESDGYKNQGDLDAASAAYNELISVLSQMLELALHNNSHYIDSPFEIPPIIDPLLNAQLVLADVVEALGEREKAEELRNKAMSISQQYLSQSSTAERERQRAASLIGQGRFNEALVLLSAAKDHFQEEGDLLSMGSVTANIAGIFEWLGDYDRALVEVKRASQYIDPIVPEEGASAGNILSSILSGQLQELQDRTKLLEISLELEQIQARTNRYLGNYEEAERQFQKILPKMPAVARPAIEFQFAAILIAAGRYKEGLEYVEKLEPAFRGLLRPKLGVLLRLKAEALLELGKPEEALSNLDAATEELSNYRDPDTLWKAQWLCARTLESLDQAAEALAAYAQTVDTINDLRKAPLGYRLDSTYLQDKLPVFEDAIALACVSDEAEACCRFMEMIKSRILTATLSVPSSRQSNRGSGLEMQVDELSRQIDSLEYTGYRDGWTDDIQQKRESLLSARAELRERIRFSDPRWRSLSEPVPFDLEQVFDILAQREQAALTLFYQADRVTGVLLKERKCYVAAVRISDETGTALANYQQNLQSTKAQQHWYDPSAGLGLLSDQLVAAGLLTPALQAEGLIIVPHGPLHLLPWAGLTFKGKRLFEYSPVSILPNLSCLINLQTDFAALPEVALIGAPDYGSLPGLQPLEFAVEELTTIQEIYSTARVIGEPLMAHSATEAGFWKLASHENSTGNIFHIACHGNFVTSEPLNSGLLFSDGKIDATEIVQTRLRYNEVILSACSTGFRPTEVQGVKLNGDDILGLPGVLLEAGACSVLVSIPRARDDATLVFMTIYHENRAEGKSPMAALQQTQKSLLSSSIYPPYLWIGFSVYGCQ